MGVSCYGLITNYRQIDSRLTLIQFFDGEGNEEMVVDTLESQIGLLFLGKK
jgi:hypothetical protein